MGQEHQTHRRTQDIFQTVEWAWRTLIQAQTHTHLSKNRLSFVNQGMGIAMTNPFTVIFDEESGYQLRLFRPEVMLDLAIIMAKGTILDNCASVFGPTVRVNRSLRHPLGDRCCSLVKLLRVDINQRRTVMLDRLLQDFG